MYECNILDTMTQTRHTVRYYIRKPTKKTTDKDGNPLKKGSQLLLKQGLTDIIGFESGQELLATWDDEKQTLTVEKL